MTAPQDDGRTAISRAQLLGSQIAAGVSFSIILCERFRRDAVGIGLAQKIERRHWLTGTLSAFWRSYYRVALAAVFINLIAHRFADLHDERL